MNSQLFREELERVVGDSIRESGADGISALISDVMNIKSGSLVSHPGYSSSSSTAVIPINDIRGLESMIYAKGEKQLRCKLAAVYRLIDLHGWTQGIYNHVTARIDQDTEHFLLNPFGILYNEVTASSLVKVNMQGETVEESSLNFGVNKAGFMLHSALHAARPDIKCIIHLHTPNIVAVSTMKCGLLPLCQEACLIGDVSYHSYSGLVVEDTERATIAKDLGPNNKVMFLRNHGVVCCGRSIEEAWLIAYHTVLAVQTQLKMMPYGMDNLILIDEETRSKVYEQGMRGGGGVNVSKREWAVGELEFEPLVKKEAAKTVSDVELPPTVSNLSYLLEDDEALNGPLKHLLAQMARSNRSSNKTKWVNSPNTYQKVEVLETGTTDPKKITKVTKISFDDPTPSHK